MPFRVLNGANIYFEVQGSGEPLILIAGYSCDHSLWLNLLEKLTQNFQVLIFDNRGSGQTQDDNKEFSLKTLGDDAMALAEALGFKNPHIVGHSMGGAIAATIAIHYSSKIGKLILLNSTARLNFISLLALKNNLALQKTNIGSDLLIDNFFPWGFSETFLKSSQNVSAYKTRVKNYPYPQTPQNNERQLQALEKADLRFELKNIKAKTLVFGTEQDYLVPIEETHFLAANIKGAELKTMPGSHVMLAEKPIEAAEIISNFIL